MLDEVELHRIAQEIEAVLARCGVKVDAVGSTSADRVEVMVATLSPEAIDAVKQRWGNRVTLIEGSAEMEWLQQ